LVRAVVVRLEEGVRLLIARAEQRVALPGVDRGDRASRPSFTTP
jgi:hypothetical protein